MNSRTWSRKFMAFCLAMAVSSVYSMVSLAAPGQAGQTGPSGELSVSGQVTVNGQSAISGATVFSDSTVTTAANSSAVVSLGKLGRVELLPASSMKISFSDAGVSGMLEAGRARVSTPAGVGATISTKDGAVVAENVLLTLQIPEVSRALQRSKRARVLAHPNPAAALAAHDTKVSRWRK